MRIVSGSWDKTLWVWDAETAQELCRLEGHDDIVWSVAFSPDGRRIVSGGGGRDKTVRVWDADSGECLEVIEGTDDAAGVARTTGGVTSGADRGTWRAIRREQQLAIENTAAKQPVAWFPQALCPITTAPTGHQWAGVTAEIDVRIIQLEGARGEVSPASQRSSL